MLNLRVGMGAVVARVRFEVGDADKLGLADRDRLGGHGRAAILAASACAWVGCWWHAWQSETSRVSSPGIGWWASVAGAAHHSQNGTRASWRARVPVQPGGILRPEAPSAQRRDG